jgi:hypothetical protein
MRTRRAFALLVGVAALCCGCASLTPTEQMAEWRERAVSRETFERVRPFLEGLMPGDELQIFAGARQVFNARRRPVVVIPAWITSLSGGAAGGLSLFGQLIGRSGDRIHGSHVFGYVSGDRIVPRYQVVTSATVVSPEEHALLVRDEACCLGVLPRPTATLYFKDLHIAGARPLAFPEPDVGAAPEAVGLPEEGLAGFYSESAFRAMEPILDDLPDGTDLLSMLQELGATFVTRDYGETHSLLAAGFLRYKRVRTQTLEDRDALIKLRPFGYVRADEEVVKRIAVFENDRLVRVVHHVGLVDWAGYARE